MVKLILSIYPIHHYKSTNHAIAKLKCELIHPILQYAFHLFPVFED